MARRSLEDACVAAIIAERGGMLRRVASHRVALAAAVRRGRMDADTAETVIRQLSAFAESCAIGLHVEGETPTAVRDALRPLVREMAGKASVDG